MTSYIIAIIHSHEIFAEFSTYNKHNLLVCFPSDAIRLHAYIIHAHCHPQNYLLPWQNHQRLIPQHHVTITNTLFFNKMRHISDLLSNTEEHCARNWYHGQGQVITPHIIYGMQSLVPALYTRLCHKTPGIAASNSDTTMWWSSTDKCRFFACGKWYPLFGISPNSPDSSVTSLCLTCIVTACQANYHREKHQMRNHPMIQYIETR